MKKRRYCWFKKEDGQAIVEAALIIPLFILILCGIIDFGWIFSNQLMINNCSREGARYAVVHSREDDMITQVTQHIRDISDLGGDPLDIIVSIITINDEIEVSVKKDVKVLTPIVGIFTQDQIIQVNSTTIMSVD